jgi:DNA segregation ATPase FtsK/SpoIIIE-like protein
MLPEEPMRILKLKNVGNGYVATAQVSGAQVAYMASANFARKRDAWEDLAWKLFRQLLHNNQAEQQHDSTKTQFLRDRITVMAQTVRDRNQERIRYAKALTAARERNQELRDDLHRAMDELRKAKGFLPATTMVVENEQLRAQVAELKAQRDAALEEANALLCHRKNLMDAIGRFQNTVRDIRTS